MKKIFISFFSLLIFSGFLGQECKNTFESNYLKLSICNDSDWEIEQSLPYIKIKTSDVATFITIYSEEYFGEENSKELAEKSFKSDLTSNSKMEKIKEEEINLDGITGTFYIAKEPNKEKQTSTFLIVNNNRLFTINNNCYSDCGNAEKAIKDVISKIKFQKYEAPKLTEKEIEDFNNFTDALHSAFKSGKSKSFEKLLVTQQLMLELVDTKMKDETMKSRYKTILEEHWTDFSKKFIDESLDSFTQLITQGNENGINWKKIEFISVDYTLENSLPGITGLKCNYNFSFKDKQYQISIKSVEILKNGMYISELNSNNIDEK